MFLSPKPVSFEEQTGALEAVLPADVPFHDQAPPQPLAQICCVSPTFASAGMADGAGTKPCTAQKCVYFGQKIRSFQRSFSQEVKPFPSAEQFRVLLTV